MSCNSSEAVHLHLCNILKQGHLVDSPNCETMSASSKTLHSSFRNISFNTSKSQWTVPDIKSLLRNAYLSTQILHSLIWQCHNLWIHIQLSFLKFWVVYFFLHPMKNTSYSHTALLPLWKSHWRIKKRIYETICELYKAVYDIGSRYLLQI